MKSAKFARMAMILVALSGMTASSSEAQAPAARKADLSRLVVVGDSLSAGFQSDSLLGTAQPHGWAAVVARQAKVPLVLPLIAPPGIPNVLELVSPGPPPIIITAPGTSIGRDNVRVQATDLAVPGALLEDALATVPSLPIDNLTDLVLGIPGLFEGVALTQTEWAVALQPTTIFVWIGNNDVLGAASAADPSLATPLPVFQAEFQTLMQSLASTGATIVVGNIPDVTVVPFFTPTQVIEAETGLPIDVLGPILGIAPGDYVTPEGVALIPGILTNPSTGPIPPNFVLTAAQAVQIRAIVDGYNGVIQQQAAAVGAFVVDIHRLTQQLRAQGAQANGETLTTAFLGGLFSLDGVHPTNTGYAVIANTFIATLNSPLGAAVPPISIDLVASTDPLVPANFGEIASGHVTAATAKSIKVLFLHTTQH
jgi:phospholipase/lecithinase/hemolysin